MDAELERSLINLWIVSQVSHNDKLSTEDEKFTIHRPGLMTSIVRRWYGERRMVNMQRVSQCMRHAMAYLKEVNELEAAIPPTEGMHGESRTEVQRYLQKRKGAQRMHQALSGSISGLRNMQQTYRDDIQACAQLTLLVNEIEDFIESYPSPASYHSFE